MRDFINGSFTEDSRLDSNYVTGFADGEGCFSISVFEKINGKPLVIFSFIITQKDHSAGILKDLQKFLGCGGLTVSKRDKTVEFFVKIFEDILLKIIPHFETYPLVTSKHLGSARLG